MIEAELIRFLEDATKVEVKYMHVHPDQAPPYVVLDLNTRTERTTQSGVTTVSSEFHIVCADKTFLGAVTLSNKVFAKLNRFKGAMGEVSVTYAQIDNQFDGDEPQSSAVERTLSLSINHLE